VHCSCHLAAALRAFAASLDTVFHAADPLAAAGTSVTNLGANCANLLVKLRTAQHEVSRRLADFGAVDHQAIMADFNVFTACLKAMGHRAMQARFVAVTTRIDASLHIVMNLSVMRHYEFSRN